jgi:hypothetical protein
MKIFKMLSFVALGVSLTVTAFADPGMGRGGGNNYNQNYQGGRSYPPGLSNSPHGLMKQEKTPYGWSRGKKRGWTCTRYGTDNRCLHWKKNQNCQIINGLRVCTPR